MIYFIWFIYGLWLILLAFLLIRNSNTLRVRLIVINSKDYQYLYRKFPSYYSMVINPKYWNIWTIEQWEKCIYKTKS